MCMHACVCVRVCVHVNGRGTGMELLVDSSASVRLFFTVLSGV